MLVEELFLKNLDNGQKKHLKTFFDNYFDNSIIEFKEDDLNNYKHLKKYFCKKKLDHSLKSSSKVEYKPLSDILKDVLKVNLKNESSKNSSSNPKEGETKQQGGWSFEDCFGIYDVQSNKIYSKYNDIVKVLGLQLISKNYKRFHTLSLLDICEYLYDLNDKNYSINSLIQKIDNSFETGMINIFKQHLHYLNINYESKFKINTDDIYHKTLDNIRTYILLLKQVLMNLLQNKLYLELNRDEIKAHIENEFYKLLKDNFTTGFLVSVLYNFNKHENYNIHYNILKNPKYYNRDVRDLLHQKHLTIISDDLIKQGNIYFDGNINKIVLIKNSLNEYLKHNESNKYDAFKLRVLLCKSQMTKMNESFNQYVTETIFNLSKEINNYEMIQTKYIYTLNWYVDYSKLENKRVLEKDW